MLKHLTHSHSTKLHTFDDFYRNSSKPLKTRVNSRENNLNQQSNSSSPISPSSTSTSTSTNGYTFYNIFSDFKCTTPEIVHEEEEENKEEKSSENPVNGSLPLFYLDDEHHQQQSQQSSPHWPSMILNRFRHQTLTKQSSINENQMTSTKSRKNDSTDSSMNNSKHPSHRFLKRGITIDNSNQFTEKKSPNGSNDDFPQLSCSIPMNNPVKKHRSFASVLQYIHSSHHSNVPSTISERSDSNKSNSTGSLNNESNSSSSNNSIRPKLTRGKTIDDSPLSPIDKPSSSPIIPKLTSLFQRHNQSSNSSEQYKHRIGNLKARIHHKKTSPIKTKKFQCQNSNELIEQLKNENQQVENDNQISDDDNEPAALDYLPSQRFNKPVIMKRVHTWHNTFDLRPIDQCLEY